MFNNAKMLQNSDSSNKPDAEKQRETDTVHVFHVELLLFCAISPLFQEG